MSTLPRNLLLILVITVGCAAPHAIDPSQAVLAIPASEAPLESDDAEGDAERGRGSQAVTGFLGGSGEVGDLEGWTFGVDYAYHLSSTWAVGGFAEAVSGLDRSFAAGLQAVWLPIWDVVLVAGPGLERHHDEWRPIVRVGGAYEFPLGDGWVLAPGVYYDFTDGNDLLIYGLNLAYIW